MANNILNTRISLANDTTANLTASTKVWLKGEIIVEFTTDGKKKIKIGDGVHTWKELDYFAGNDDEINGILTRLGTAEGDIDTLEGKVSTAEGKISTAEGNITTLQGQVNTINGTGTGSIKKAASDAVTSAVNTSKLKMEVLSTPTDGYLKSYKITQNGESLTIDIPKDMVVSSGEVVTLTANQVEGLGAGTYLKLTIANQSKPVYIAANSFIQSGFITGIKVNGTAVSVSNKVANITVNTDTLQQGTNTLILNGGSATV